MKHPGYLHPAARSLLTAIALMLITFTAPVNAQDTLPDTLYEEYTVFDSIMASVDWVVGPDSATISDIGKIALSENCTFTGREGSRTLMEAFQNPLSEMEQGFICSKSFSWWAIFEWDPTGYVKDDEKADLDADKILQQLRDGTKAGNEEREDRGWVTLEVVGWAQPPHYDESTHNLEWATIIQSSDGYRTVNHNSRILGRRGIMHVTLVTDVDSLDAYLPEYRSAMAGFSFIPGETYAEYREGDKIAEYGLTALVVGGGAAVAAKAGLFKYIWKILLVAGAGAAGMFKKFFGKKKGPLPPTTPGT